MVRKTIIILLLSLIAFEVIGQNDAELITAIEEAPVFGGDLKLFIKDKVRYPQSALEDATEGTVYIGFYIDTAGFTFDHYVLRGVRDDLDEEALRVAKLIRFDSPAKQRGKPIVVHYMVPVKFALDPEELIFYFDTPPSFDHGGFVDRLNEIIYGNLMRIDNLKETQVVYVQFVIDTLGFTHDHNVLRGVNEQLDAEALRVSRLIKFDHPAKQLGKPISIKYVIPIKFQPPQEAVSSKRKFCDWWRKRVY